MPLSPICLWKTDIFLIPFSPGLIMNLEACQEDVVKLVKAKISHSKGDSQQGFSFHKGISSGFQFDSNYEISMQ